MGLTEIEKVQIKALLDEGQPLPLLFREKLFPHGSLDEPAYNRATVFNQKFDKLVGEDWTKFQAGPKTPLPPPHVQAAWPWRRELWTNYFVCRRSLGNAYCQYSTGEFAEWSDAQRALERLCCLETAFTAHNGMEDRIAQLANCFTVPSQSSKDVSFCSFFKRHAGRTLAKTNAIVGALFADSIWNETHDRANKIKHRWTGEIWAQFPEPAKILADVDGKNCVYSCYGLVEIKAEDVDRICETTQQSLNLLVKLAKVMDEEIGWDQYFEFAA